MAERIHILKTQILDISLTDESKARDVFAMVSELSNDGILSTIISKCFDEFCSDGNTYVLERIELELDPMTFSNFKKYLPVQVYEQLRKALAGTFDSITKSRAVEVRSYGGNALNILSHFFDHGFLPWNTQERNLNTLIEKCVKESSDELVSLIRKKGQQLQVRIRIAERFENDVLIGMINALVPADSDVVVGYHKHLIQINRQESIVDVPQNTLEKTLWLFILNHLIVEQQTAFNRKSFSLSMLRQFSCHYNIAFTELLFLIQTGLQRWKKYLPASFLSLMEDSLAIAPALSHERLESNPVNLPRQSVELPLVTREASEPLDEFTRAGLIVEFIDRNPAHSVLLLRSLKDKQKTIHKLVCESKNGLAKKIIKAVDPADYSTIVRYHANLVEVHSVDPGNHTAQRDVENILWTFMIIHCLENHQSYFNHKAFLKSVIFSFSAHYNLSMTDLLEKMIRSASILRLPSASMRKCVGLIREIYLEIREPAEDLALIGAKHNTWNEKPSISESELSAITQWPEKKLVQWLKENRERCALELTTYMLNSPEGITRFTMLSDQTFWQVAKLLFPSSTFEVIRQFSILCEKMTDGLWSSFNTKAGYSQKIKESILETSLHVRQSRESNHTRIFQTLMHALVSNSSQLTVARFKAQCTLYREDEQLKLVAELFAPKSGVDKISEETTSVIAKLIHQLLSGKPGMSGSFFPGFFSLREALTFICEYYPERIAGVLTGLPEKKRERFFERLANDELELLYSIQKSQEETGQWISLLSEWEQTLSGHNNRTQIVIALKRVFLIGYVFNTNPSIDNLAERLTRVFKKFQVPNSFFDNIAKWTLPRYGSAIHAIQQIENHVTGRDRISNSRKKSHKQIVVKDVLSRLSDGDKRKLDERASKLGDDIYVRNAGLVLAHPYFTFLFEQTRLLENGKFRTQRDAMHAVALLHYAGTGQQEFKEEDHVLNKLLCGEDVNENSSDIKLTPEEISLVNGMLNALAEHWTVIKNSTEDDVRGNWFLREGRLREQENHWELTVKRQPYDLLLNSLPFTLSPVKYPWMKKMMIIYWL